MGKKSKEEVCEESSGPASPVDKIKNIGGPVGNFINGVIKGSCPKQLAVGTVTGWVSGVTTIKLGKPVAFALGSSIILIQLAQHQGLIKSDWSELKSHVTKGMEGVNKNPELLNKSKMFAKKNPCFAAGFVGGFLIGMVS